MSVLNEGRSHLALIVKYILHDTQIDIPFQRPCKEGSSIQYWDRNRQVQYISIDHCNKVVVFAHDSVGYVMGIHSLL
jgi:hypothetical protein